MTDDLSPRERLTAEIARLGLTVDAVFIPWSQSRNAKPNPVLKDYQLNWKVTLKREGIAVLTTDYSAGQAYCPSYVSSSIPTLHYVEKISKECEIGRRWSTDWAAPAPGSKSLTPDPLAVIHSLVLDAEAIDHPTYEEWASSFDYDPDSRKGEALYRACLEHGLRLRAALGDTEIGALREACQDF